MLLTAPISYTNTATANVAAQNKKPEATVVASSLRKQHPSEKIRLRKTYS